jgi:VCBS repeat-containing protein
MQDLLTSNITTGWEPTSGGNMMRIVNGKIELDITNALNLQAGGNLNGLGVDDTISDSFVYSIRMSNGTLSWARVTFSVTGQNDGPTVEGAIEVGAQEDEAAFEIDLLAGASDADHGDVLSITDVQGLEAGVALTGTTLTVDPTSSAFQSLELGEDKVITITYNVTDGHGASVAQSATITVTGTNDTPTVAAALTGAADEDDATFDVDLLAGAADVDHNAVLNVTDVTGLEAGVSITGATLSVDPDDAAFQSLKLGEDKVITVTYNVTDEHGASVAQSATITITGTNDTPTVGVALTASADEDDATFDVDLLAGAADVDHNAVLSVTDVAGLEAGVSVTGSTLSVDPSDAAFQSLELGEDKVITVTYNVTDEHGASVAQSATITITGTNDIPTVAAALTGAADEDDATFDVDLLAGAADVDNNAVLTVTDVAGLETGVSFSGSTLSVDPADAAFQSLELGEDKVITVTYNVTDEHGASVAQSATITITGTNDTPTVAAALTASADEDDAGFNVDLLAGAADVDHDAALSVTDVTGLEDGVSVSGSTLTVDPSDGAFQALELGEDKVITVTYNVTDEHGASVAQSATITIQVPTTSPPSPPP